MSKRHHHSAHHREALINRRRFVLSNALLVSLIAGVVFLQIRHSSQAANGLIQGYKVPNYTAAAYANIYLNGGFANQSNPYSYTVGSPTDLTVSAQDRINDFTLIGYTDCYNSTSCHSGAIQRSNNVRVHLNGGDYHDLWWHYDQDPKGNVDANTCHSIAGWAFDPTSPGASIAVHIYVDGNGVAITANGSRPDVNSAYNIPGNHGFTWAVPAGYRNNVTHRALVYAIDPAGYGNNPQIGNASWSCPPDPTPPPPPPPSDKDHDGVPDSTDRCPTQAGPASNGGCPVSIPPVTRTSPAPGSSSPVATADTQPPTDPTNLVVKYENQEVKLNWTASTDNSVGLKYQIERSLDNSTWSVLSSEVADTNYSDRSAAFEVKYFYRVKAIDAAGNASGYITVEFTTPKFQANVTEDSTTIESDDGLAKAILPRSAVDGEVACGLVIDSENRDKISQKLFVAAGPYRLHCQKENGDEITSFKQPVTILVTVPKDATKDYTKFKVFSFKTNWSETKAKYAKKTRQFSFTTTEANQFVVLGEKRKGIAGIVSVLFLVIVAGGGFFFFKLRQAQKQSYNDYLRKKYYDL